MNAIPNTALTPQSDFDMVLNTLCPSFEKCVQDFDCFNQDWARPEMMTCMQNLEKHFKYLAPHGSTVIQKVHSFASSVGSFFYNAKQAPFRFTGESAESFGTIFNPIMVEDCFEKNCPDVDFKFIHPRTFAAAKEVQVGESYFLSNVWREWIKGFDSNEPGGWETAQEFLRFRADDPREKALYITTTTDFSGDKLLSKALEPRLVQQILLDLSKTYDTKYAIVQNYEEICQLIDSAQKTGALAQVYIDGHGNPHEIVLRHADPIRHSDPRVFGTLEKLLRANKEQEWEKCFDGIKPNGKIVLLTCETGRELNGYAIAQGLANKTSRAVFASTELIEGVKTKVLNIEQGLLFHPREERSAFSVMDKSNSFRPFFPSYKFCPYAPLFQDLSVQEREATDTILFKIAKKMKFPFWDMPFWQYSKYYQFTALCEDNPKAKFLVLSAPIDGTSNLSQASLNPNTISEQLFELSNSYDLKYKTIFNLNQICEEFESASKIAIMAGTVLEGAIIIGGPTSTSSSLSLYKNVTLDYSNVRDLSCLSKINENATLILLGSTFGKNNTENETSALAQKVSEVTKKRVYAPVCDINLGEMILSKNNQFSIKYSEPSLLTKVTSGCWEDSNSIIKEFVN